MDEQDLSIVQTGGMTGDTIQEIDLHKSNGVLKYITILFYSKETGRLVYNEHEGVVKVLSHGRTEGSTVNEGLLRPDVQFKRRSMLTLDFDPERWKKATRLSLCPFQIPEEYMFKVYLTYEKPSNKPKPVQEDTKKTKTKSNVVSLSAYRDKYRNG